MPKEVREIPIKWHIIGSHNGDEREFLWFKIKFDYGAGADYPAILWAGNN